VGCYAWTNWQMAGLEGPLSNWYLAQFGFQNRASPVWECIEGYQLAFH